MNNKNYLKNRGMNKFNKINLKYSFRFTLTLVVNVLKNKFVNIFKGNFQINLPCSNSATIQVNKQVMCPTLLLNNKTKLI